MCLIKGDVIISIYVDDFVIISKNDKRIAETMNGLRKRYTINDERKTEEYLGIPLEHTSDSIIFIYFLTQ